MPLHGKSYILDPPVIHNTIWDDVVSALREGTAPEVGEILTELQSKFGGKGLLSKTLLSS